MYVCIWSFRVLTTDFVLSISACTVFFNPLSFASELVKRKICVCGGDPVRASWNKKYATSFTCMLVIWWGFVNATKYVSGSGPNSNGILTDCVSEWLMDWLTYWLIVWITNLLINWLIEWLADWPNNRVNDCLIDSWLSDWVKHWLTV